MVIFVFDIFFMNYSWFFYTLYFFGFHTLIIHQFHQRANAYLHFSLERAHQTIQIDSVDSFGIVHLENAIVISQLVALSFVQALNIVGTYWQLSYDILNPYDSREDFCDGCCFRSMNYEINAKNNTIRRQADWFTVEEII